MDALDEVQGKHAQRHLRPKRRLRDEGKGKLGLLHAGTTRMIRLRVYGPVCTDTTRRL